MKKYVLCHFSPAHLVTYQLIYFNCELAIHNWDKNESAISVSGEPLYPRMVLHTVSDPEIL